MSMQGPIRRSGGAKVKRALGVQAALEWAFRVEQAQLELPIPKDVTEEGFGFGLEYILLQRAALGCKVDGGQHKMGSYTHPDAEVIAASVAGMPDRLGGIRMAIQVAELARAGLTPDWMPGVVPRCVPLEIKNNQHGERATTIVVGTERVKTRGKWRTVELLACPVTWRPHPEQIASARRGYDDWWLALDWVRDGLMAGRMLREVEITATMPKVRPWELQVPMSRTRTDAPASIVTVPDACKTPGAKSSVWRGASPFCRGTSWASAGATKSTDDSRAARCKWRFMGMSFRDTA